MGLHYRELERLTTALQPLLDATVQEVYQPSPFELVLELRHSFKTRLLLFSIRPGLARLHPIDKRPPNPQNPLPFQNLLRAMLAGRLESLALQPGDRVLTLTFQGQRRLTLVAELFDRRGALILLDEQGVMLGSMNTGSRPERSLAPGQPYPPPPPPKGEPKAALDRFSDRPLEALPEAVAEHFAAEAARQAREDLRARLLTGLRREARRLERLSQELASDLKRAETAEQHRRWGDLLQIYLREATRGMTCLTVPDLFQPDAPPLDIPLDPLLDPVGNLQRHYRLYRKYDASIVLVLERMEATDLALHKTLRWLVETEEALSLEELTRIEQEARLPLKAAARAASRKKEPERLPYLRYLTRHGREIRVGRSAADNDLLTFRVARGNDFWLHVRGRPGAHVVIPGSGGPPDLETLLDGATLALRHSGIPLHEKAEVAWTRVKYVRKVPGGNPGLVTYTQDKTLWVDHSEERLAAVLREE